MRIVTWFKSNRKRLPLWANRAIDYSADLLRNGLLDRITTMRVTHTEQAPIVPVAPEDALLRVLVAPHNFAGQAYEWAHAIATYVSDANAMNLAITRKDNYRFRSSWSVPGRIQKYHRTWQRQAASFVATSYTHVLVEAESAIFGGLFKDLERESDFLHRCGISTAYLCHGSDIRSPALHRETTSFSPFAEPDAYNDRTQRRVDRNRSFLESAGSPVFVSTPDLLNDFPRGIWLPVVVDQAIWRRAAEPQNPSSGSSPNQPPLVVHIPSNSVIKGTHLIQRSLDELTRNGNIRYESVSGVTSEEARKIILNADIVLDQFRLGSYGVAACEAMAAGKVVIGHVIPRVRHHVLELTGVELPIVEANPETIGDVLRSLVGDADRLREISAAGEEFVNRVHSGEFSARILERNWLRA